KVRVRGPAPFHGVCGLLRWAAPGLGPITNQLLYVHEPRRHLRCLTALQIGRVATRRQNYLKRTAFVPRDTTLPRLCHDRCDSIGESTICGGRFPESWRHYFAGSRFRQCATAALRALSRRSSADRRLARAFPPFCPRAA